MWHEETVTASILSALDALNRASLVSDFYLAGGTGLALRMGHRRSEDLDFFSARLFDEDILIGEAQRLEGFALLSKAKSTAHAHIKGVKLSFLGYQYPVLYPPGVFRGVTVADTLDIACMKISAIASRGTKRDFIDLYVVAKEHGLQHVIELFQKKYAQTHFSSAHVLKSLFYFEEAEKDPMPDMLAAISWEDVRNFFEREVPALF